MLEGFYRHLTPPELVDDGDYVSTYNLNSSTKDCVQCDRNPTKTTTRPKSSTSTNIWNQLNRQGLNNAGLPVSFLS
jgi:hypothetical protein